jgi:anti-sigma B factor antagonist
MANPLDPHAPEIADEQLGGIAVVVLSGEFDAYSGPAVEEHLMHAIEAGVYEIVVDMEAVTFVDMSTLNGIVRAIKEVYRHNGHLLVVTTSRAVLRTIDLAGLRHSIRVVPTRADALAVLRPAAA